MNRSDRSQSWAPDPVGFRRHVVKDERLAAVLDKCAEVGKWGRAMAPGTAQGIAVARSEKYIKSHY